MTTETKSRPKLSVIPPGYWRNVWDLGRATPHPNMNPKPIHLHGTVWMGANKWPSKEVAEEKAADSLKRDAVAAVFGGVKYLGPEFFEE